MPVVFFCIFQILEKIEKEELRKEILQEIDKRLD